MYTTIIHGIVGFLAAFIKGMHHQTITGGNYKTAIAAAYLSAAMEASIISFILHAGWAAVPAIGTGFALGTVVAMHGYRRFLKHE